MWPGKGFNLRHNISDIFHVRLQVAGKDYNVKTANRICETTESMKH